MPTPPGDVAHLLRRAGFGGTFEEVRALAPLDIRAIVDRVVEAPALPVAPPSGLLTSSKRWEQWVAMQQWWYERMRTSPSPFHEKMALFWHGHLCSGLDKVQSPMAMWNQHLLFRLKGLGSFVDLVQAVSIDPAMLEYLDNDQNVVGSPNENYARELMELFTLGVNQYTQDDVLASARAWTGHGRNKDTGLYEYHPRRHDNGPKTFFGITKSWTGPQIVEEILLGKRKQLAAKFLVSKLWSFFAYPNPEPAIVDALAATYLSSNLNIKTTVKSIFLRPEFYSSKAKRGLVRSPAEYMAAAMKGAQLPATTVHPEWWGNGMGQLLFSPPNVSGWRPNGYWISASAQWAKVSFANFVRWKMNETGALPVEELRRMSPEDSVKTVLRRFMIDNAGPQTKSALVRYVQRQRADEWWAERPNLIFLVLMTPEMQLA